MSLQDKMNVKRKTGIKEPEDGSSERAGSVPNYEQADKGNLTARQNGYVGGYMTKEARRNGRTADVRKISSCTV